MEFAERAEIDVVGNYIDQALTTETNNRPEFQQMIKDSYKHAFDCIIVWKLDRFARNRCGSSSCKNTSSFAGALVFLDSSHTYRKTVGITHYTKPLRVWCRSSWQGACVRRKNNGFSVAKRTKIEMFLM